MTEAIAKRGYNAERAASAGLAVDRFPRTEEETQRAELAIAQKMEELTMQEREKCVFDVHGIDTIDMVEDAESINSKISLLNKHLDLIPDKPAYDRAKELNPEFVGGRSFQLMCLRKELYDPEKAAEFMVYHLEKKMEIFGDGEILAREIRLTDLTSDDLASVKSGFLQVCPSKDVAGRTIISYCAQINKHKNVDNLIRAMWYITAAALRDEEAQKKGIVMLLQNYGTRLHKFSDIKKIRTAQVAIGQRARGAHFCFSNPMLYPGLMGIKLFFLCGYNEQRFRLHFGEPKDVTFELQTFGIPADCCPKENPGNQENLTWHHEWLRLQQMKEESDSAASSAVIIPNRFDVLFGKGKKAREHPGTIRCQMLVELMKERYEQASRQEKTIVADQIMAAIKESKGRFLKCEKGLWVEVEHSIGREKISHWFRHMRSKGVASSKADGINSSSAAMKRPIVAESIDFSNKRPGLVERPIITESIDFSNNRPGLVDFSL